MTITLRSFYLDTLTYILLNDVNLATGDEIKITAGNELEIVQETDTKMWEWRAWYSAAIGSGLITGGDIVNV